MFGEGPLNVIFVAPSYSNVEHWWEEPDATRWLHRLASYARVAMFDKRGTGMSDRVAELPGLDQRMDDLRAVIDAADMEERRCWHIGGRSDDDAVRCDSIPSGVVRWCSVVALRAHHGPNREEIVTVSRLHRSSLGYRRQPAVIAPSRANDPIFQRWWGRFERLGGSPAAATGLMLMNSQIDISDILPTIRVPTLVIHRTEDRADPGGAWTLSRRKYPGRTLYRISGKRPPTLCRRQR